MNLSWKGKGDKNLEFPEHYWKYLINTLDSFQPENILLQRPSRIKRPILA